MERVAEEEVRIAPGLSVGGVRGTERCGSSLGLFLRLSPELSVVDVGEAAGGEVILAPGLSARWVGSSVGGAASTGISLRMSLEISVGDVGTAAVVARLALGLSVRGVGGRAMFVNAPSARLRFLSRDLFQAVPRIIRRGRGRGRRMRSGTYPEIIRWEGRR